MSLRHGEILIDDGNYKQYQGDVTVDGTKRKRGLIPRDFLKHPVGSYRGVPAMRAVNIPLIPRSEWSARIKHMNEVKSRLSDIRLSGNGGQPIPSLDQDGVGYCWGHSSTHGVIINRAIMNQPFVPLSAFAVCATIKNGRDEGGWGAQSLDFIMNRGVPAQKYWPQQSRDLSHGTAQCWENAALHKVTHGWVDVEAAQYDRDLSWDQVMTLLLSRVPVVGDFNWWGHSVLLLDPVEIEPGSFGVRIWNSWGDTWSDRGMGVLRGSQARPDGAVAPTTTLPSMELKQAPAPDYVPAA